MLYCKYHNFHLFFTTKNLEFLKIKKSLRRQAVEWWYSRAWPLNRRRLWIPLCLTRSTDQMWPYIWNLYPYQSSVQNNTQNCYNRCYKMRSQRRSCLPFPICRLKLSSPWLQSNSRSAETIKMQSVWNRSERVKKKGKEFFGSELNKKNKNKNPPKSAHSPWEKLHIRKRKRKLIKRSYTYHCYKQIKNKSLITRI